MSAEKRFLDSAYEVEGAEETRALYQEWAKTYDDEVRANGYASPARAAAAFAECVSDKTKPLLDLGCGTGLSGEAFSEAGFTTIDGTDFSEEMLAVAAAKGVYRQLLRGDLNNPIPGKPGEYSNIAAVGVFSPGHAPPELVARVVELLGTCGCFVFSLNDHALEDGAYEAEVRRLEADGKIDTVFSEYGDHLPGHGIKSKIYVVRKR
jgi:predicted TPR repeat methyltransferase